MRDTLRKYCDSFIKNRDTIKSIFSCDSRYVISVCASAFAARSVRADSEKIKECRVLLKKNTNIFSCFRGVVELPVITMLALSENPEKQFNKIKEIYAVLKKHFSANDFLAYTAAVIAEMVDINEVDALAERGKKIYKLMKKEHPFLTSYEDSVFAMLMAFCEQSDEGLIFDMEVCYGMLKKHFPDKDSLQSLSHVIALAGGDIEGNAQRVVDIYDALKNAGRKYGKYYTLSALGTLAILPVDIAAAAEDILQVDNYLSQQKGYGFWGLDKKTRLMHSVMIVSADYAADQKISSAAVTVGTLAMIAAQQAAACAAVAASVAAANGAD